MAERTTNEFITLLRTNSTAVAAAEALKAEASAELAAAKVVLAEEQVALAAGQVTLSTEQVAEAQAKVWEAEAKVLTAASYSMEAEDVFVKIYTSVGDGTFTATPTTNYSLLHWAAKAEASATLADTESGTYTPTLTPVNGVLGALHDFLYTRMGNNVTVTGAIAITPNIAAGVTVEASLPIPSVFNSTGDLSGSGAAVNHGSVHIQEEVVNYTAFLNFTAVSTTATSIRFSFTYIIKP